MNDCDVEYNISTQIKLRYMLNQITHDIVIGIVWNMSIETCNQAYIYIELR